MSHPHQDIENDDVVSHEDFTDDDNSEYHLPSSAQFLPAEENYIRNHDLKVKTFEALHGNNNNNTNSTSHNSPTLSPLTTNRRLLVIDLPANQKIPLSRLSISTTDEGGSARVPQSDTLPEGGNSEELHATFRDVKACLGLRRKYLDLSLQANEMDNPKNKDDWDIYPPPPKPTYKSKNKFNQLPGDDQDDDKVEFDIGHFTIEGPCDYYVSTNQEDIFTVYDAETEEPLVLVPTLRDYYVDLNTISKLASDGPIKSFAFQRLLYLEARWKMYALLNEYEESKQSKQNPHRDFYNVRKVDTHIHHSACMNQKHLLRFIKYKLKTLPDEKVIFRDGKILSLKEVFESLNLTGYDLSIDTLDMHAHTDSFHRFDKFNLKYNPIGESRLREIFLKTDNFINGQYLAELTKQVFEDLEASKYQHTELRISIYGRSLDEWDKLASWIVDNRLFSHNVRWLIQVPRLYDLYKKNKNVQCFQDIMKNLFLPLFEALINPQSHPKLHIFLQRVIGFDSVDDESKQEKPIGKKYPKASKWEFDGNPPYSYYLYYIYANMTSLNHLRMKRNFNTLVFRPHCGEAGDPEHLISAFLVAHSISHGILLRKLPFIQYLYYLDQIGIAMSPLSNNALFLTYDKNPFFQFFQKGLNVSLSTDDPLQFSYTKEPLIEEYSVAAQIYKLSPVDMCELAYNSCRQSGWEARIKKHWLGKQFYLGGVEGNDVEKTNVPPVRLNYRHDTLQSEMELVDYYSQKKH